MIGLLREPEGLTQSAEDQSKDRRSEMTQEKSHDDFACLSAQIPSISYCIEFSPQKTT
jgi:hypothetical protein